MIVHREIKDTRRNTTTPIIGSLMKQLSVAFVACLLALFLVMPSVHAGTIKTPTVNPVFYDATTISGGNLAKARVNKKTVIATVHVTLKGEDGTVKATLEVTPKSGATWKVDLPKGVKVAKGDTVTVYQQIGEDKSSEVTANAQPSKASTVTPTMPSGEIWIEQTSSNQVNNDEQAEAVEMFNNVNTAIAGDIKSVKFSIDGTDHAYYEVTYTDGSTSGKIEAPKLKIKTVTEKSAAPTIEKVQVTDEQIIVTLEKEVAPGTKFYFVKNFTDGEDKIFCGEGKCKVDKSTSEDKSQAVTVDGKKVTFPINSDDLELGKDFGIIVKEPHKFRSCAMSQPVITAPEKVAVRDPHKLTDEDKKAIDKAIRDANTKNGKSKLPDGTGTEVGGTPAIIEFDKDGNVTIISPNDVVVSGYDSEYNPIFAKNPDGTYQLNPEAKVTKFPAKDLVKNIAPKSPEIAVDINTGKVTITPPAYVNPGDDTDLASYKVSYKNADGEDKTVTIKRTVDGTGKSTWSSEGGATVDENTGVVTLEIKDLAVGDTISAIAKDKGGLADDDTDPLESDQVSKQLETVEVSYDSNGGSGNMDSHRLNKGSKYTILENAFTAPKNQKFDTWEIDSEHIKAGTEIKVNKNTIIKALWKLSVNKNIEVPNPVEVRDPRKLTVEDKEKIDKAIRDANTNNGVSNLPDGIGDHAGEPAFIEFDKDGNVRIISPNNVNTQSVDGKTVYQKKSDGSYDVIDEDEIIVIPAKDIIKNIKPRSPKIGVDTGTGKVTITPPAYVNPGDDTDIASYKVSYKNADGENKTTTIKRTVDGNGKSTWSSEDGATVDENTGVVTLEIKDLAVGDTITAIAKDKGGLADDDTNPLESDPASTQLETVEVSYDSNGGSGNMDSRRLNKGQKYTILENKFTAPRNQKFDTWELDGEHIKAGTEITVNKNTIIKALWKLSVNKNIEVPNPVEVRDPRKLTDEDKEKIDKAIRDVNTKNGVSNLPDGIGNHAGVPAFIEFDKDGNVRIISPNNVNTQSVDGKTVYQKKSDGSYDVIDESQVINIPAKDIIKNIKPRSPKIAVDTGTGKVTITPPAYVNPGDDTDIASYKVSYKNADGENKTTTIKRTVDGNGKSTWSSEDGATVDENTGVVTLEIKDLAVGDTITAIAKDKGGLADDDTDPLYSDPVTATLETVEVVYDANGGTGNMEVKKLNKLNNGLMYKLLDNEFTAPNGQEFDKWEIDGQKFDPGTEIKVNSNIVVKATWKALPNPPKNTDKVHIVAPQTGDVSILALCSPAILASVGMVALFRKRKEKR